MRFVLIILTCVLIACAPGRKVTYDIPVDYPDDLRREAITLFEKGKVLYRENCSSCHGIFTRGKKEIPNFTEDQLNDYAAIFLRNGTPAHAVARKMSVDQLNQVIVFLRFRKQTTVAQANTVH